MLSLDCELRRIQALRLWEDRLQSSDSVFVRLVFLSQLRDASGRYTDPFLAGLFSPRNCHKIIAGAHREVFREWLGLSARTKLRELQKYCQMICKRTPPEEAEWTTFCRELVPSPISISELNLFRETGKRLTRVICRRDGERRTELEPPSLDS